MPMRPNVCRVTQEPIRMRAKAFRSRVAQSLSVSASGEMPCLAGFLVRCVEVCVIECALQGMAVLGSRVRIVSYEKGISGLSARCT